MNGFVKQFDSEDDDDFFKSTPVSKVEHKPDKRSKNGKDMYVLSSDTEPDDVKVYSYYMLMFFLIIFNRVFSLQHQHAIWQRKRK